jgi:hypothetical protein
MDPSPELLAIARWGPKKALIKSLCTNIMSNSSSSPGADSYNVSSSVVFTWTDPTKPWKVSKREEEQLFVCNVYIRALRWRMQCFKSSLVNLDFEILRLRPTFAQVLKQCLPYPSTE